MEVMDLRGLDSIGTLMVLMEMGYEFEPVKGEEEVAKEKENS